MTVTGYYVHFVTLNNIVKRKVGFYKQYSTLCRRYKTALDGFPLEINLRTMDIISQSFLLNTP